MNDRLILSATVRTICALAIAFVGAGHAAVEAGELHIEGPQIQGGLLLGKATPGSTVRFDGESIRVSDDGAFLIGFNRDAPARSVADVEFPDGSRTKLVFEVQRREYEIQRIDGLPSDKVDLNEEDLARVRSENASIAESRLTDAPRQDFLDGFVWPSKGIITGVYGTQRFLNGQPRQPHYGIDIAAPVGAPVVAPAGGVVTLVHDDMFFSGGTVILDHGHGLSSAFLHLSRILVAKGDRVSQGELIAEVGATGRVTGPHLDWRINLFSRRLDPALLAGPMPR